MTKIKTIYFIVGTLLLFCSRLIFAATDDQAAVNNTQASSPPSVGNFALRGSQQPGPLYGGGDKLRRNDGRGRLPDGHLHSRPDVLL